MAQPSLPASQRTRYDDEDASMTFPVSPSFGSDGKTGVTIVERTRSPTRSGRTFAGTAPTMTLASSSSGCSSLASMA